MPEAMFRKLAVLAAVSCTLLLSGCFAKEENKPPTAVFVSSASAANVNQDILFDGANSSDRDGKVVRFHWDFGDGTEELGVSVLHRFARGGNYTVTLTVTDNEGKKDRANSTLRINEYPKARIGVSAAEAKVFQPVTFDASNSSDPDGTLVRYAWEFGDGTNATGRSVSHAFSETGIYRVNLTVEDDFGAPASDALEVSIVLRTFEVSWMEVPHTLPQISDSSLENSTKNNTVALLFANMTSVEFKLSWKDDICHWLLGTANDDFSLKVCDPGNNTQSFKDMKGNITLDFRLAELPSVSSLKAKCAADVLAQMAGKYTRLDGFGNWTAAVVVGLCGGAQDLTGVDLDTGNSWKLDVRYTQFEIVITEK
jgi:PKD repeat protein